MWQAPSTHGQSSSSTSETVREEAESDTAGVSGDPADIEILPSSPDSLQFCGVPVDTSSFVSQLLPDDSVLQMGSDVQSQRLRGHRKRTSSSTQRVRPYRLPDCDAFIETPTENYNERNMASCSIGQMNNEEGPSFRHLTKRSFGNQHFEHVFEDNRSPEVNPSLSNDLDLSQNSLQITDSQDLLLPSEPDQDNNSMGAFPHSLVPLRPPYIPSNYPVSQLDNGYQNSSSVNDLFYEPGRELSVMPLIGADDTQRELYELNSRCIFDIPPQISNITKPLLHLEDPFLSPHRRVFDLPMPTIDAQKLANNLIKLSRHLKCPDLSELCCLDCRYVPVLPVTSKCGHTRCTRCIQVNGSCPCGEDAPKEMSVNTVIREITEKMLKYINKSRMIDPGSFGRTTHVKTCPLTGAKKNILVTRRQCQSSQILFPTGSSTHGVSRPRVPMTIQARHYKARHLIKSGKYLEAAPHLVRVAASSEPFARVGRQLLAKTISAIHVKGRAGAISRKLFQSVREQATLGWLRPADLECVLCTSTYSNPVTTPCGHSYCRACIERSMYYKKQCPLCQGSLENFSLPETRDNIFISCILSSIDMSPAPIDTDVIPIVTCYVAFPGMPCPLFIFDPRYWLMVRRVLESGSRRFGMLAYDRGHTFADFGTVLEICDCVVLEDSRCIVSTVGISRFRVVERFEVDGFDVARIQALTDITPTRDEAQELHMLAVGIYCKAIEWLKNMYNHVREEIETAFGGLPYDDRPEDLGTTLDGPNWLWWLIAILPLKSEIKILILSTRSLLKRMLAVSRTLDVMDSNFTTSAMSEDLANQEEWLARQG